MDVYKQVILAIKSKGRVDSTIIGEALKHYAVRWLPDSLDELVSDGCTRSYKYLVETLVCLLPLDKGVGCPCSFLLKLLKIALFVGVDDSSREDLVNRISLKLYEASVKDLLIPAQSPQTTLYDVELVQCLVNRYVSYSRDLSVEKNDETNDFVLLHRHRYMLSVGKTIDEYLSEIAHDPNLTLASFVDLSQSIPESARPTHDGLYKAVDTYLKKHPSLTKAERKKICALMDVKKMTTNASMHAAQNDLLPLRVVVQVLFFEQVRACSGVQALNSNACNASNSMTNSDEEWEKTASDDNNVKKQMSQLKVKEEEFQKNGKLMKKNGKNNKSGIQLLPSRSRRIFDRLWVMGKGHGENRSSDTSGSSQSPTSMVRGDAKSSGSSSRQRRHSIS